MEAVSAQSHAQTFTSRRRKLALAVVALAFVMDLLDTTIVNIAIPSIQHNLSASYATIQWLIAGYAMAFAVLLIIGGRLGDIYGYKKLFLIGVTGFTLASLLSGLAWAPGVLIFARLLQGSMAALMVPQVLSVMQIMYPPQERAVVNGLFGALGGLSATLGPVVGGLLIKWNLFGLDWRPVFLINIPVGIFALIAGARVLPNGKSEHPLKLDVIGTAIIIGALFLLIFPLVQGRELGWPGWTFIMLAASLPIILAFAWYERRKMAKDGSPLVVPALFHFRSFSAGMVVNIMFEMAMVGYFLIITLMLQIGLGYSAIKAGLTGIPFSVGVGLSIGAIGTRLLPKFGRYVVTAGSLIMAAGVAGVALTAHHYGLGTHPWQFIASFFVGGFGMGLTLGPLFSISLNDVDVRHAGSASGVMNAVQQVGGAIGVAVIGVLFFGQLSAHAGASSRSVEPQLQAQLAQAHVPAAAQGPIIQAFETCFKDRSGEKDPSVVPASCKAAQSSQVPRPVAAKISAAAADAGQEANARNFATAFSWSIAYTAGLLVITALLSLMLPRHIRPEVLEVAEGLA